MFRDYTFIMKICRELRRNNYIMWFIIAISQVFAFFFFLKLLLGIDQKKTALYSSSLVFCMFYIEQKSDWKKKRFYWAWFWEIKEFGCPNAKMEKKSKCREKYAVSYFRWFLKSAAKQILKLTEYTLKICGVMFHNWIYPF